MRIRRALAAAAAVAAALGTRHRAIASALTSAR
ncbi:hypothetical protein FHS32_002103 [Streptomyces albaduncus]|uniref:Uncharacterized protein n=1 Tax=Streptomyces griseoloalbus TaxID=67303 RepID=A0A7W8F9G8_9ACTN|nr:hypothetical protein [Streptomyces albaduncus]